MTSKMPLLGIELEHEIPRKSLAIALDGLHQHVGLYPVQCSQLGINDDPLATQHLDPVGHQFQRL